MILHENYLYAMIQSANFKIVTSKKDPVLEVIQLRCLGNAAYIACHLLLLLCPKS